MKLCTNCGHKNPDEGLFCENCGQKLTDISYNENRRVCSACGCLLEPYAMFCENCGAPQDSAQKQTDSESVEEELPVIKEIWEEETISVHNSGQNSQQSNEFPAQEEFEPQDDFVIQNDVDLQAGFEPKDIFEPQNPMQQQSGFEPQNNRQRQNNIEPQINIQKQSGFGVPGNRQTQNSFGPQGSMQPPKQKKGSTAVLVTILSILVVILLAGGGTLFYMYHNKVWLFAEQKEDDSREKTSGKEASSDGDSAEDTEKPAETSEPTKEPEAAEKKTEVNRTKPIKVFGQIRASSELAGGHEAANLVDYNADNAWAEGVAGTGIGEYVMYKLRKKEVIYGIAIMPGCLQSSQLYAMNSRPTKLTITAGKYEETLDISGFNCDFSNIGNSMMYVDFKEPVETDEVVITIAETALGQKDDTYISEMYLYTYPEKGKESAYSAQDWQVSHQETAAAAGTPAGYILPDSASRYLTKSDLAGLTQDQCRIARNEIYARHGRMFDDPGLQAYFNSCTWYRGSISAADFNDSVLNDFEKANRDLIVQYETEQGYR